ncbi:MAG: hypothetical protein O2894_07165 [Planctomycetota bacterium]|nr:hypothetical protein [Planctomycetota bacterium]
MPSRPLTSPALLVALLFALAFSLVGCGDDESTLPPDVESGATAGGSGGAAKKNAATLRAPEGWPSADARRLAPDREPSPFGPQQIAAGCGPDSRRIYRFQEPRGEPTYQAWTFTGHTAEGCTWHSTECDAQGQATGETKSQPVTWVELQSHASWPAQDVTASEAKMTTPAGPYSCMHYVVKRAGTAGHGEDRFWFAYDLPGPPLMLERYVSGTLTFTLTLMDVRGVPAR